jgi:eukaryotic-like serine/threonine-protein kinase
MATTVRITVITGPHKNRRFCFRGPTHCTLGRAGDCFVQLAGEPRDDLISRHHCQLDIYPPCVFVEDLGSLNGTYRNGSKLEPLDRVLLSLATSLRQKLSSSAVQDGDIITVGGTSLQVDIVDCPPSGTDRPVWTEGEVAKRGCSISC